jgi:hypothetical protein
MRKEENERPRHSPAAWAVVAVVCLTLPAFMNAQKANSRLCTTGMANCFLPDDRLPASPAGTSEFAGLARTPSRVVNMYVRTLHGGPLAHHWIEVESSRGPVTVGFGPATIPFIDAGQISIWYADGKVERRGAIRLFSTGFNYAKPPGEGYPIGEPIHLTVAQSDALVEKERHRKFVFPYIPIFHDCRTFVCAVQSSVRGRSTLPCYLLFKGYW